MATTGTAVCPHELNAYRAQGMAEEVALRQATKTGPLIQDHTELLRHRDESLDPQIDRRTGKSVHELTEDELAKAIIASTPRLVTVEVEGVPVTLPGGYRPCFQHVCPAAKQLVTLYGDSEPYRITLTHPETGRVLGEVEVPAGSVQ